MEDELVSELVDWSAIWDLDLIHVICEVCDCEFLIPPAVAKGQETCPNCHRDALNPDVQGAATSELAAAPELLLPFTVGTTAAMHEVQKLLEEIRFPPNDFTIENLRKRLRKVYVPVWLVDGDVEAQWRAEVGYHYEVVSHQESMGTGGSWNSQQVKKVKTRWEPRAGSLKRHYDNVTAPAMEGFGRLTDRLGLSDKKDDAIPYTPLDVERTFILLPDRTPTDAWTDAKVNLKLDAAQEVKHAATADEIRDFQWTPNVSGQNWTNMLIPLYSTYYLDDQRHPQVIFTHGRTGKTQGMMKGSIKRARVWTIGGVAASAGMFLIAMLIGLIAALAEVDGLVVASVLLVLASVAIVIGSFVPLVTVVMFNRKWSQWQVQIKPYDRER